MKRYLYSIVLNAISLLSWSQTPWVKGKVVDANSGAPLQGASIRTGDQQGTTSDRDGVFTLECKGTIQLTITFVGYESYSQIISDCSIELSVMLKPANATLSEIEITATSELNRSLLYQPTSIARLGTPEIKRATGLFLDDAINANVPGVFMQRRAVGSGQQFNIRGYGGGGPGPRGINSNFDQQGIKAYLNGIPLTDAEGISVFDDIDFGSIGNVEITKGPSGTLYGLAIAGVVNLQTQRPEKQKISVSQDAMVGSYGLNRFTSRLAISTDKSSLLINYGKQNYSGFMQHTASTKDFVNLMGDVKVSDLQTLTAYVGWSNSYDQRNGELTAQQYETFDYSGNPAYIKNDAHSNVVSFRAGVGQTYQISRKMSNTTSVFGTGASNNASSAGGWTDKVSVNYGFRSVFDTRFDLSENIRLSGITGIEAQKQNAQVIAYNMVTNNVDPAGYSIIGSIRSNQTTTNATYSLFTQWTLSLPHDFSFTAGIGTSSMDIALIDKLYVATNNVPGNTVPTTYATSYANMLSPHLAINKVVNSHSSVYFSYSKGYKAPVSTSIYTPLAGTVNSGLRPESGTQYEIGTKGSLLKDRLVYEVALFNATFADKMTLVGVPNASGTATLYSYVVNSGSYDNKGLEAAVRYSIFQSEDGFIKLIRPFANVAYSDYTYDGVTFQNNVSTPPADYTGNAVAGVPRITANGGVDFQSRPGLYGNITYLFRDGMPYTPDGLLRTGAYNLLNAKIGFRKVWNDHFEVDTYFGANNITSIQYYQMVFVNQVPDVYLPGPKEINYFGGVNVKYIF